MMQKIFERSVMKMGREPEHSLTVTIPKKICKKLQIEKGTRLYFKLEGNKFIVSKDTEFLDNIVNNDNYTITTIDSAKSTKENGNKKKEVMVDGVSLAELQY